MCSGNKEYYLRNVYLPYEFDENRDRFNDYMAKMLIFLRNQCLGIFFFDFCNEYSLSVYDLPIDTRMSALLGEQPHG